MLSFYLLMLEGDGQRAHFEELYKKHRDYTFKIAFALTKDEYDAEDALQETWYRVAKNMELIHTENEKMLKSFLFTLSKNCALAVIKRRDKNLFVSLELLPEQEYTEDALKLIEGDEAYRNLVKKILSLPEMYKSVLSLNLISSLSCSEIAKILSFSQCQPKTNTPKAA